MLSVYTQNTFHDKIIILSFVCASVVSYVALVLSLFVSHLSSFCASGKLFFMIVARPGYLHLHFCSQDFIPTVIKQ